jgi:hypothetical protein
MYFNYYGDFVEDIYPEGDGCAYYREYDEENYDDYEEGYYGGEDERYYYERYDECEAEEDDVPEDLSRACDKTEEAFMGYLDARKKMPEFEVSTQ